jgi:arsenate reductase (thioredoxin)
VGKVNRARKETSSAAAARPRGEDGTSVARAVDPPLVLFLCRANAAASILAEAILRHLARGRVRAASAGDTRAALVNSYALECLAAHRISTIGLYTKPWGQFFGLFQPPVRVLITLCDVYAAKSNWDHDPLRTVKAHWPTAQPETVVGGETEIRLAFEEAFVTLEARIRRFLALSLDRLSDEVLSQELAQIGQFHNEWD